MVVVVYVRECIDVCVCRLVGIECVCVCVCVCV